ncbi:MAG: RNA 3'-terminal phosphate cyclase [Candidatus Woesearchaeota archaeon]|jgi:RNA 3'-phosphate cyclase|nr:RNA 3'-terminal phosphate cyclase [Candidatus Woesearchaeota archaeon]MDP6266002.1 RNA 3'-terminal phosphate cyclase [Candidatus Woesearchaeota archaeon]MDP7322818.1 RNA 3'-terminal phosphate cyclase [Candidatus Woesearchaeota archaeon]MDP7476545.1 RNA 3'-terminal phosphate cyclase [Candidatus Woesearchaeota archaeon]HJO01497.1 RNA 3'-terminal phosphate cyclase [Candidatus Woesearchaeota archaeon]|tara:strand:- start:3863 stop:4957 length:1095 start_codon:yes stop_codon:yes gene_type:complete
MIELDGSYGEAGGSIARIALALSTITQQPFEIANIRKNRPQPGLKNQHLFCIKALEKLCNAKTEGAQLGSTSLKYIPGKIEGKTIDIDIQTAGSIPLFLQAVLLPSMFANKTVKLNIIGGTDSKWAAPIDYFKEVFLPQLQKYADIECKLVKRGYYPKGNGNVQLKINPIYKISDFNCFDDFLKNLKENAPKINLTEQGHLIQIKGISHASSDLQNAQVSERQAKIAEMGLKHYNCPINIQIQYNETLSTGSGITLWAIFSLKQDEIDIKNPIRLGADSLGERGKKAEIVGKEAAQNIIKEIESRAPVDMHLADQILKFMALISNSKIKTSKITNHTRTNIYTIEKFLGKAFSTDEINNIISTT